MDFTFRLTVVILQIVIIRINEWLFVVVERSFDYSLYVLRWRVIEKKMIDFFLFVVYQSQAPLKIKECKNEKKKKKRTVPINHAES